MEKIILLFMVSFAFISCSAAHNASSSSQPESAPVGPTAKITMSKDLQRKLDAQGRLKMEQVKSSDVLEVLIRTHIKPNPSQVNEMKKSGFTAYSEIDEITSGKIAASSLNALAALIFVEEIQISAQLYPDRK